MKQIVLAILCLLILSGCASTSGAKITPAVETTSTLKNEPSQSLFDDFSYSTRAEMTSNGWTIRSGSGWPGVTGATFRAENVSFLDYPDQPGNRLLRMSSSRMGRVNIPFKR